MTKGITKCPNFPLRKLPNVESFNIDTKQSKPATIEEHVIAFDFEKYYDRKISK